MKKILCLSILFILTMFIFPTPMFSHEFDPPLGIYRWSTVYYNNGNYYAYVKANGDNMASWIQPRFVPALSEYNNNSWGNSSFVNTSYVYSNCDMFTAFTWPLDEDVGGITLIKNASGLWRRVIYPLNSGSSGFNYGYITYAEIALNPDETGLFESNTDYMDMVIRHEMGHVLGLGHNGANISIMYPYFPLDYTTLQYHDRSDLEEFYP